MRNLSAPPWRKWREANFLGVSCVILHPGAHMGAGESQGIARVARALNRALSQVAPPVRILLENTAGQGSSLGHSFDQLAAILERVRDEGRIGVCVDTCHTFAAGYDIRTEEGYAKTMREFDRLIGTRGISVFHVNDCKKELGSRVDRHTHIGRGQIGLAAFRCLVNDRRFAKVPKILETPKGEDLEEDKMNLATPAQPRPPHRMTVAAPPSGNNYSMLRCFRSYRSRLLRMPYRK